MANEYDNAREGSVSPGDQHPGGGPAATEPGQTQAPEEVSPTMPAGDAEAPAAPPADGAAAPTANGGEPGEDHEQLLVRDLEELTAKAEKADEYLELAKRTKADFENYRKRAAREAAAAQDRGIAKLAKELLPAVDNLDRAVQAAESAESLEANGTLASGIKLVHADVLAALQRAGIERYSPQGEPFDPTRHEAIAQQPVEGAKPGTIVEVYQQGYLLGEAVIRPARVVVAG
jgi:molecular chaperone GrpE